MSKKVAGKLDLSRVDHIAVIGECMLELSGSDARSKTLAYGGDTLNSAVYMARAGIDVHYVTALGDDSLSDQMLAGWRDEGIHCELVSRVEGRVPGLYMIETDDDGERSFYYWRDRAPAREIFGDEARAEALFAQLQAFPMIYLTGVTLSLYAEPARDRLLAFLKSYRQQGGLVAFDSNFRPQRWPDLEAARDCFSRFYGEVDLALPTIDDECQLFGLEYAADSAATIAAKLSAFGVGEILIKQGAAGCQWQAEGGLQLVAAERVEQAVDTTGAGDSFNAGYLSARLQGREPLTAAAAGHRLAAQVVQQRGAIVAVVID